MADLPAGRPPDEMKRMVWEKATAAVSEAISRASLDTLVAIAASNNDAHYVLTLLARDVPPAPPERLTAEQKARAKTAAFRARLSHQAGAMLDARSTAMLLGVSLATVAAKRRRQQLLGVPFGREIRYPRAQFQDGKPLPGLARILTSFGGVKPWVQLQMLLTPIAGFAPTPRTMLDLLHQDMSDEDLQKLSGLARSWAN